MEYITIQAIAEFKVLTSLSYCKKTKLFKAFFQKEEYAAVLKKQEFITILTQSLKELNLNKKSYLVIADFYDLFHTDLANTDSELSLLYEEVSKHICLSRRSRISELLLIPLFAVLPFAPHIFEINLDGDDMVIVLFSFLSFVLGCCYLYRILHRKCSHVSSQIVTLLYADILLFFIYTFQIWSSAFRNPQISLYFLVYFLMFSCAWIIILILFICIRKIIKSIHKKTKGL